MDEDGCIICLQLNQSTFIPAACDVEDCKRVFGQEDYDIFAFSHFEEYFDGDMDGVMINPGSTGFIVNRHYSRMVFNRINDEMKPPVTKGYDSRSGSTASGH